MENQQSFGFTGVWIPKDILTSRELTPGEKILYANIASFDKACFESNERLADKCGLAERSVSRGIQKLQELGFVFVEVVGNNSSKRRLYTLSDSPKKVKYLVSRGLLRANSKQTQLVENSVKGVAKMSTQGRQNGEGGSQNGEPLTDGGSPKCLPKNNKEEKRENVPHFPVENSEAAGMAGKGQPALPRREKPRREDFETDEDWYEACCAASTIRI